MGYMACMGNCVTCGRIFSFNPHRVPSVRVRRENGRWVPDEAGSREPVCLPCIEQANRERQRMGRPLIQILPGAYEAEECI
jgi:hypothetical protein